MSKFRPSGMRHASLLGVLNQASTATLRAKKCKLLNYNNHIVADHRFATQERNLASDWILLAKGASPYLQIGSLSDKQISANGL
ncbi:hypothetical protein [Mesorhizobium sp. M8A.F.Ca.ET.165.01.1.1]|uniref:hypothetical protein n=1 Tax=Mesorhizobium sp. M8A.F.Ca.ET.165.01.1.1 TaxID=2563960 RepID=UPI00109393B6|nr:hypothetical protein [Mesorhizobium sp. M8A.F.Ca.ET.165.01.1.1]TGT46331.1 hypothetical protein EN808_03335 [Mesorhizobium sp. M8A.F.Ca.ET.165.01.1.1]